MKKGHSPARQAAYERLRQMGHYSTIGRTGGENNVKKYGKHHMSEIGILGGQAMVKTRGVQHFKNMVAIRDGKALLKGTN